MPEASRFFGRFRGRSSAVAPSLGVFPRRRSARNHSNMMERFGARDASRCGGDRARRTNDVVSSSDAKTRHRRLITDDCGGARVEVAAPIRARDGTTGADRASSWSISFVRIDRERVVSGRYRSARVVSGRYRSDVSRVDASMRRFVDSTTAETHRARAYKQSYRGTVSLV